MNIIQLQIPAAAVHIDIVRLCLYGIASRMGFTYEEIEDMKVAVSEACNNAITHRLDNNKEDMIDVSFEMMDEALSIIIKDNGPGFDYANTVKSATSLHDSDIASIRVGGLGIFLMQALMDKVEVTTDHGTIISMTKYMTSSHLLKER